MKTKSAQQKLNEKQPLFFSIGLVIALLLVISAFEWKQEKVHKPIDLPLEDEAYLLPPIPSTVHSVPPPPQPMAKRAEKVTAPQKTTSIKEAIAEIDPKDFTEPITIDIIDLPGLPDEKPDEIFIAAEEMPSFKGGLKGFYDYFAKSVQYPKLAKKNNITGTVVVSFVIDRDGSITDIKVIKGIGFGFDEEAIRVLENAPKWNPGKQRGEPVKVSMVLPIKFALKN